MRTATILFISILFSSTMAFAEANEPCKGVIVPTEIQSSKVIFEMPTYNEYVEEVVLLSLRSGKEVAEENILNEVIYNKIRKSKIKEIKSLYNNDYQVMTKEQVKSTDMTSGFIFQEQLVNDLVSENNAKFEQYTTFSIKDIRSDAEFTLADPSKDATANCIVQKGQYKYADIIAVIQK